LNIACKTDNSKSDVPLVTSGAHSVFTNIFQALGAMTTAVLIARLLSPADKGVFDLYFTLASLLNIALQFSVNAGITYAIASQPANLRRIVAGVIAFSVLQGMAGAEIVKLLARSGRGRAFIPAQLGGFAPLCVGAGVAALALFSMSRAILAGQRRFITANYGDMAKQGIGISFILVVFALRHHRPQGTLLEVVIANLSAILIAALYFLNRAGFARARATAGAQVKTIMSFAAPAYAANLMQYMNYRLDVFLVSYYRGSAAVGLYQVGVYIVLAVNMIPQAAQKVLFPTISARNGQTQRNVEMVATSNRLLTTFGIGLALILACVMPVVIPLALGKSYQRSVSALLWLLPGCVAFITANIIAAYFSGIGRQSLNTAGSAIGLVSTLGLDFLLIPRFGFLGAACASSVSYFLTALYSAIVFARITEARFGDLYLLRASDRTFVRQIIRSTNEKLVSMARRSITIRGESG